MADFKQFRINRDEDGNIEPITVTSPRFEFEVELRPLTVGDTYQLEGWGDSSRSDWSLRDKALMLQNNIVSVDGESLDLPEDTDEAIEVIKDGYKPYAIDDLVVAIIMNSGLSDMFSSGEEGKELKELLSML